METIFLTTSLILSSLFLQQISSRHIDSADPNPQFDTLRQFFASRQISGHTYARALSNALLQSNSPKSPNEKPCCYPKTWQGIMYRYPSVEDVEYFVTFYEDDVNQKLAVDVVVTPGNSTTPTRKVSQIVQMDSPDKKAYIYMFDKEAKKCRRQEFDNITYDQLTGHCIPDDAFYGGVFTIGIPQGGANLPLRSWVWKPLPKELPDLKYERLVTSDCAPVLGITRGLDGGEPVLQTDYYFNIQTSIKDPSVFNLPDYCKQGVKKHRGKASKYYAKNWMKDSAQSAFFQL